MAVSCLSLSLLFWNCVEATSSCGSHLRSCLHLAVYLFNFVLVNFFEAEHLASEVFSRNVGLECASNDSLVCAKEQEELLELCCGDRFSL